MNSEIRSFFAVSDFLEHEVLLPLSHIRNGWELYVDSGTGRYEDEEDTFAWLLSHLIYELARAEPPEKYHDSEDGLAEHVQNSWNWRIEKHGNVWKNESGKRLDPSDYLATLKQGGFRLDGDRDLRGSVRKVSSQAAAYASRHTMARKL